jgi:uncharacterized membrane protein YjgN (DUF898 family)
MNTPYTQHPHHTFQFHGQGSKYFSIVFVNLLLTIVTLGLYYPWAKCSKLKYLYENTEFSGSNFHFAGTGKELFMGFIKIVGVLLGLFAISFYMTYNEMQIMGILIVYISLFLLVPVAIHGSYKYRLSRTVWRGIHFGYRGELGELFSKFIIGGLITVFTFGIYSSWFTVNLRKYILGNVRMGDVKFHYNGNGGNLFIIHVKGFFLTILTLGIYSFWYSKDLYNYYIDNIILEHKVGEFHRVQSEMTGGDFFELFVVNYFLVLFTLGLGFAWAEIRTYRYLTKKLWVENTFKPDTIAQTEANHTDATGDDLASWLDVGIV